MISALLKLGFMPTLLNQVNIPVCPMQNGIFTFWLEIPLALNRRRANFLASLVKLSLEMLENPSARELMQVVVAAGLAQNLQPYAL
jgi:hypothetical protein